MNNSISTHIFVKTLSDAGSFLSQLEKLDSIERSFIVTYESHEEICRVKNFIKGGIFGINGYINELSDFQWEITAHKPLLWDLPQKAKIEHVKAKIRVRDEFTKLATDFKRGHAITFDLSILDTPVAEEVFDLLSGLTYALAGNIKKESSNIFTINPSYKVVENDSICKEISDKIHASNILLKKNKPFDALSLVRETLKNISYKKNYDAYIIFKSLELRCHNYMGNYYEAENIFPTLIDAYEKAYTTKELWWLYDMFANNQIILGHYLFAERIIKKGLRPYKFNHCFPSLQMKLTLAQVFALQGKFIVSMILLKKVIPICRENNFNSLLEEAELLRECISL